MTTYAGSEAALGGQGERIPKQVKEKLWRETARVTLLGSVALLCYGAWKAADLPGTVESVRADTKHAMVSFGYVEYTDIDMMSGVIGDAALQCSLDMGGVRLRNIDYNKEQPAQRIAMFSEYGDGGTDMAALEDCIEQTSGYPDVKAVIKQPEPERGGWLFGLGD